MSLISTPTPVRPPRSNSPTYVLAIPFEWLRKANALGGSTVAVASGLWFYAGLCGSRRFKIDSRLDLLCGLTRQTRNHILQRLHYSQLIVLTPKHGAYPTVEILALAKA